MARIAPTPRGALALLASLLIAAPAAHAAFPGTNGDIAFERDGDILVLAPGGTAPAPLLQGGTYSFPAISPDGTKIAYNAVNPSDESTDIWAISHDGTGAVNLSAVGGDINADSQPAWSPDGSKIAFINASSGASNVWTMNADGTNRSQITFNASTSTSYSTPAWSPDGAKIAFTISVQASTFSQPPQIWIADPIQPGQPSSYDRDGADPSWAPDGLRIAFQRGTGSNADVYVDSYPVKQGKPTQVTFQPASPAPAEDSAPAFSPDGTRILFASDRANGLPALFSAPSSPTAPEEDIQPVTTPPGPVFGDSFPDWGPLRAVPPVDTGQQQGPPPLPPPARGKTVNAEPVSGEVFVKLPPGAANERRYAWANAAGGAGVPKGFIRLSEARQLPVRTVFDTRRGTVGLTVARNALGTRTQHAEFGRGRFAWDQSESKALTTMTMRGGRLKGCKRKSRKKVTTARRRGRSIFGSGTGRFRTRGRRSTATVRGTTWLQKDTCRGTLTVVREGTVVVKEVGKRRPITISTVKSGKPTRHFAPVPKR